MSSAHLNITSFQLIKILREKIWRRSSWIFSIFCWNKSSWRIWIRKEGFATKEDIAKLETKLVTQIEYSKLFIILWLIGTMIALFGICTGLIIHFLKWLIQSRYGNWYHLSWIKSIFCVPTCRPLSIIIFSPDINLMCSPGMI